MKLRDLVEKVVVKNVKIIVVVYAVDKEVI